MSKADACSDAECQVLMRLATLVGSQQSLDALSTEDYDAMADSLVDAALGGDFRAIQEIGRALDEWGEPEL